MKLPIPFSPTATHRWQKAKLPIGPDACPLLHQPPEEKRGKGKQELHTGSEIWALAFENWELERSQPVTTPWLQDDSPHHQLLQYSGIQYSRRKDGRLQVYIFSSCSLVR